MVIWSHLSKNDEKISAPWIIFLEQEKIRKIQSIFWKMTEMFGGFVDHFDRWSEKKGLRSIFDKLYLS